MTSKSNCLLVSLSFLLSGVVAAVVIGVGAAAVSRAGWAPIGIFPLGVGVLLGVAINSIVAIHRAATERSSAKGPVAATQRVAGRTLLVVGTTLLALLTAVAEHAWLYHDFRRQWQEARANSAEVALFRPAEPWSPVEYFSREATPIRVLMWVADAALVVAAAVSTVVFWHCRRTCHFPVGASPAAGPLAPDP